MEDNFLKENYHNMTATELMSHFPDRTRSSINHRIRRLNLTSKRENARKWKDEEDVFLQENYSNMTVRSLAEELGRSPSSVQYRLDKLCLRKENSSRRWTSKEDEYISNNFGLVRLDTIARKLGRTERAVEARLNRLGIYGGKNNTGFYSVYELADALCVDNHTIYLWINKHNLLYKKSYIKSRMFMLIDTDVFWEWAENNKELINWSRVPERVIVPEPEWVSEQRRIDRETIPERSQKYWTDEEDKQLLYLYHNKGLTQEQVGHRLNRSRRAVQRRLTRIITG